MQRLPFEDAELTLRLTTYYLQPLLIHYRSCVSHTHAPPPCAFGLVLQWIMDVSCLPWAMARQRVYLFFVCWIVCWVGLFVGLDRLLDRLFVGLFCAVLDCSLGLFFVCWMPHATRRNVLALRNQQRSNNNKKQHSTTRMQSQNYQEVPQQLHKNSSCRSERIMG